MITRPDASQINNAGRRLDYQLGDAASADAMGAAGDGSTNDTAVLVSAFAAAKTVVLGYGKTYAIDANFTIPAGTRLFTNGATLKIRASSSDPGINVESNVTIDALNVSIPSGVQNRGVYILNRSDVEIGSLSVLATDQQGPSPSTLQALAIDDSSRVRIGYCRLENFDRPVRLDGNTDLRVDGFSISSYVRGIYIESCTSVHIGKSRILEASPNASVTAGHNALLIQSANADCSDLVFEDFYVANSGEHGIRIGGGSFQVRDVRFVRPLVKETGASGIKIQGPADGAGTYLRSLNIKIIDPILEDIGPADMSAITDGFDNYNAMVLKYIDGLTVSNPIVRKSGHTYSAKGGIYLQSIVNGQINGGVIADCKYDGIKIDTDSAGNVDVQDLTITDTQCLLNGQHGINILYPAWTIRRLVVDGVKLSSNTGYGVNINIDGGAGTINTMLIDGVVEANTAGGVASDNAGVVLTMRGQFNAPGTAPRNGSTWLNRTGGEFLVLKAGVWTAM